MADLLQHIESSIGNRRLIKRGEKILVAVSGGMDSMVLLHVLEKISARNRWKITVAHFNHRLRGRASDLDEALVRQTAAKMKLPMVVDGADVKSFALRSGLSVEMAARKLRHEFLARAARRQKIKTIVLAHHADDQVELFFLRLLRGSGSEGLGGMKWKSSSPAEPAIQLVRPLLDLAKADLQGYVRENRVRFRHDRTNFSSDILRNRIRNQLLPSLCKDYQPALAKTILRSMEIIGTESDFVREVASRAKVDFENLPVAVQRRALHVRLIEAGVAPDFDLIESLRQAPGKFVSTSPAISVTRDGRGKIKLREERGEKFCADERLVKLQGRGGQVDFKGERFKWRITATGGSEGDFKPSSAKPKREYFDADKIGGRVILRHWRMGDRFRPIGMKAGAKLQDLFVNAKIPRHRRHELVVAVAVTGEIFWVQGLRIAENFKLTPRTRRKLAWEHRGL